jgi:hypothetical protein
MSQDAYKTTGSSKLILNIPSSLTSDPVLNLRQQNNANNKRTVNISINRGPTPSFQQGVQTKVLTYCKESLEQIKSKIPEGNKNFYKENFKNYKKNIQTKIKSNHTKNPKNESGYFQALHSMRITNDKPLAIHMPNSSLQNNTSSNIAPNHKTETSVNQSQNNNFNRYWSYYYNNNTSGSSLGVNKPKESFVSSFYNRNNSQMSNDPKIHSTFSHRNYTETGKDLNSKLNTSIMNKDDSILKKNLMNKTAKVGNLNTDGNQEKYERPKSNNTKKLSLLINSQMHSINNRAAMGGSTKYSKEKSIVRKNKSLYSYNANFNAINLKNNNISAVNSNMSINKNTCAAIITNNQNKKLHFLNVKNKLPTKSIDDTNTNYNSNNKEYIKQDKYKNYLSTQNENMASEPSYIQYSTEYVGDFYKNAFERSGSVHEYKNVKRSSQYRASQKSFYLKKNSSINSYNNLFEQFNDPDQKLRKMKSMDNLSLNLLIDQEEIAPHKQKLIKNISIILNGNKDNSKKKYDNSVKLKQYIKNNKSLSLIMTKEKYKELIKDIQGKNLEENNNMINHYKNISINIDQEKTNTSNLGENKNISKENFNNKIPTLEILEKETIVQKTKISTNLQCSNSNLQVKENTELIQYGVLKNKNKLKNNKNLSYANPKLLLAAKNKNKEINLHMLKALIQDNCKKNIKPSKEKTQIKEGWETNYESRNQNLNVKSTQTFDDDFDEFNSIVKQIKYENIDVNKENIFSQNNFLYEAFDEKFNYFFSHVMLPDFTNKL